MSECVWLCVVCMCACTYVYVLVCVRALVWGVLCVCVRMCVCMYMLGLGADPSGCLLMTRPPHPAQDYSPSRVHRAKRPELPVSGL